MPPNVYVRSATMINEYNTIEGDVVLDEDLCLYGMVTGDVTVPANRELRLYGMVSGNLTVEADGSAIVHGMVCKSLTAFGRAEVAGTVVGVAIGPGSG